MKTHIKSINQFHIKQYKLPINESPKALDQRKSIKEIETNTIISNTIPNKSNTRNFSLTMIKKKNASISPTSHNAEKNNMSVTNFNNKDKNIRSLSIYTENNHNDNNDIAMKNEELMLKILQPLNCDNVKTAKKFTELKGFFNSLIMISPTKNLTNMCDISPNKALNKALKKKH